MKKSDVLFDIDRVVNINLSFRHNLCRIYSPHFFANIDLLVFKMQLRNYKSLYSSELLFSTK